MMDKIIHAYIQVRLKLYTYINEYSFCGNIWPNIEIFRMGQVKKAFQEGLSNPWGVLPQQIFLNLRLAITENWELLWHQQIRLCNYKVGIIETLRFHWKHCQFQYPME